MSKFFEILIPANDAPCEFEFSVHCIYAEKFHTGIALKRAVQEWCGATNATAKFMRLCEEYGHVSDWDGTDVSSMAGLFKDQTTFNDDISRWNTANVTVMSFMFTGATAFNQPLNCWNTSKVKEMLSMFSEASQFNQPLDAWQTGQVVDMRSMFQGATAFRQPLTNWNTGNLDEEKDWLKGAESYLGYSYAEVENRDYLPKGGLAMKNPNKNGPSSKL